jgi:hypothetical protein
MTDLDASLSRLNQTVAKGRTAAQDERAAKWARIQAEAPELASWMKAINEVFGRPKSVRVTIKGERIF